MFRSKMKDEDWDTDTVIVWHIALNDLAITADEFDTAKRKSLGLQWPPTAPADFLALGRTETAPSEYPDTRKAYEHAVDYAGRLFDDREDWQHVVIYETAYRIGFTKLATQREKLTWYEWQQLYPQICSEHKAGADFKLPLDKSRQLGHNHTPVQPDSTFNSTLNDFFAKYGSKKGETV